MLGRPGIGELVGAVFFKPQPPVGLGLRCVSLDTYSYAQVTRRRLPAHRAAEGPEGAAGARRARRAVRAGRDPREVVDEHDLVLRRLTYSLFVELGRAPTAAEVAEASSASGDDVLAGWRRLHDQHALVLNDARTEIRMANPFSAVPTAYRVLADGRWWYGNCAWDAFGICAALKSDGRIESSCPDCGEPLVVNVRRHQPDDDTLLFHCLVPASHWWDDIVHT